MRDIYAKHRAALIPLLNLTPVAPFDSAPYYCAINEQSFVDFLIQQGVAPLWHQYLSTQPNAPVFSEPAQARLLRARTEAAAHYALQKAALLDLRCTLDEHDIHHAVYKGAANREAAEDGAELRPAADIDVLVSPNHRDNALRCLTIAGWLVRPNADTASHEVNLQRGAVTVDLHWDILRPGRTRAPVSNLLLGTRVEHVDHWSLNSASALFIALVHPVFAKYATAPQSTLIRCIDLEQLLVNADLQAVVSLLNRAGLRTAAWIMLQWRALLTVGHSLPGDSASQRLTEKVAPGLLRQHYLNIWIERNLPAQLAHNAQLVRLGFTSVAHDKASDAWRALRGQQKAHRERNADVATIQLATHELNTLDRVS